MQLTDSAHSVRLGPSSQASRTNTHTHIRNLHPQRTESNHLYCMRHRNVVSLIRAFEERNRNKTRTSGSHRDKVTNEERTETGSVSVSDVHHAHSDLAYRRRVEQMGCADDRSSRRMRYVRAARFLSASYILPSLRCACLLKLRRGAQVPVGGRPIV